MGNNPFPPGISGKKLACPLKRPQYYSFSIINLLPDLYMYFNKFLITALGGPEVDDWDPLRSYDCKKQRNGGSY